MKIFGTGPSKLFRVNFSDLGKGLVIAAIGSVLTFLIKSLDAGHLVWDWKGMVIASISGALAYIVLTFFTPPPK